MSRLFIFFGLDDWMTFDKNEVPQKVFKKNVPEKKKYRARQPSHTHTHKDIHFQHTLHTHTHTHTQNRRKIKMLTFMHPYVAVIVDFINAVDAFMDRNGAEFNSYVLSIMMIVVGYAKFIIRKRRKRKG